MLKLDQRGVVHFFIPLILLIGIIAGVYLITVGPLNIFPKAREVKIDSEEIEKLTDELKELNEDLESTKEEIPTLSPSPAASPSKVLGESTTEERDKKINQMVSIAIRRKEKLLKKIEENPKEFLELAELADQVEKFPKEVQPHLEKETKVEGTFEIIHQDNFEKKESKTLYSMEVESPQKNDRYFLYFASAPNDTLSNKQVTVEGISLDSKMAVTEESSKSLQNIILPQDPTIRSLNIGVILFKFQDTGKEPFSKEDVRKVLFENSDSIKNYYLENSFNKLSLSGDITDWLTIPVNKDEEIWCNDYAWSKAAAFEAEKLGMNLNKYNRFVYVFPNTGKCWYGGLANLAGEYIYINGFNSGYIYAHEIGHTLGLWHANALDCGSKAIDEPSNCWHIEYGDPFDVMGGGNLSHFNGPHKNTLNLRWLNPRNIENIGLDGIYTVYALEKGGNNTQLLKISKQDTKESYYLNYRKAEGFDGPLPTQAFAGAMLHISTIDTLNETRILRVRPNQENYYSQFVFEDGDTFNDNLNKIHIKQLSHNQDSATLEVKFEKKIVPAVACNSLGFATFDWTSGAILIPGKSVSGYSLRINKSPGSDWSPNTQSGDKAIDLGNVTTAKIELTPGNYEDWTIQAKFTDGSKSQPVRFDDVKQFSCPFRVTPSAQVTQVSSESDGSNIISIDSLIDVNTVNLWVNNQESWDSGGNNKTGDPSGTPIQITIPSGQTSATLNWPSNHPNRKNIPPSGTIKLGIHPYFCEGTDCKGGQVTYKEVDVSIFGAKNPSAQVINVSLESDKSNIIRFSQLVDVNVVNLWVDSQESWDAQGNYKTGDPAGIPVQIIIPQGQTEGSIIWPANHPNRKNIPQSGTIKVGIHPYFCVNSDPNSECKGGDVSYKEVSVNSLQ